MPRATLRCFFTICIIVTLGLLASFLDRVIKKGYIAYNSPLEARQSKRSQVSEMEYSLGATNRLSTEPQLSETLYKLEQDNLKLQQPKQMETSTVAELNSSQNGEFEISHEKSQVSVDHKDFKEITYQIFKRDWCRMERARLDWKNMILPCLNHTTWEEPHSGGMNQITDPSKCYISHWDIRKTGEFSRFFIQTMTTSYATKKAGGDSWRVHVHGASSLAPSVFDHRNGTYEVLFLIMEDGDYEAQIFLDYSLCHGFKDPPRDWFKKGNSQGKNQPDGTLKGDRPYLISPFRDGEKVHFFVPPSNNSQQQVESLSGEVTAGDLSSYSCDPSCGSLLWDGFGRWVKGQWQPYISENVKRDRISRRREGTFFSFGDSISNGFLNSLTNGPYRGLCEEIFTSCQPVYHWVYDMHGYWGDGVKSPREPTPDNVDYDHEHVMSDVKKTLLNPDMSHKSVLLLNMGIHFAAAVNFTNYKRVIDQLIVSVSDGRNKEPTSTSKAFKGSLIWKTTTALNRERFPSPHKDVRRFLTFPRVELYNAYATSAMCRAGIDVIDVYPISNSYPGGTASNSDPVHYANHVFRAVESLLYRMFSS